MLSNLFTIEPVSDRQVIVCITLIALLSLMPGLIGNHAIIEAEARCAAINEHMVASGDLLIPRLEGRPHLTKPPLFHWLAFFVAKVTGQSGLTSVRLVSAGAAFVLALLVFYMGSRSYDRGSGFWAAVICVTSYGVLEYAHRGMFDTLLAFFVTLSIYSFLAWRKEKECRWLIVWTLALAAGFMTKGFLAWILPIPVLVVDMFRNRPTRQEIGHLVMTTSIGVVLGLLWYGYLLIGVPEAREVLLSVMTVNFGTNTSSATMAFHDEPFWYYFYAWPLALLPWLFLMIPVGKRLLSPSSWNRDEWAYVLWLFIGACFLFFVPAKAVRYLVPLIPAWSLLAGRALYHTREIPRFLPRAVGGCLLLIGLALPFWLYIRLGEAGCINAIASGVVTILGIAAFRLKMPRQLANLCLLVLILFLPIYYSRWLPAHRQLSENHHSPEYKAYRARRASFEQLFKQDNAS